MSNKFTEQEHTVICDALKSYMQERIRLGETISGINYLSQVCENIIDKMKENMED